MRIPIFQVDAFTNKLFSGNPAAVCPLESWLPDTQLQAIAAENNLAETAFFTKNDGGYHLRWFTPTVEVDLCGHATLASAFIILTRQTPAENSVRFDSKSGELVVTREGDKFTLDFPSRTPSECHPHPHLATALGGTPEMVLAARDYLVVYGSEDEVRGLQPDMELLKGTDRFATIATAPGDHSDYVMRFFAPAQGIPEDPATGSAHCTLIPYWSNRLGKTSLHAFQVSLRGGEFWCEDCGPRVHISGQVVCFLEGSISI